MYWQFVDIKAPPSRELSVDTMFKRALLSLITVQRNIDFLFHLHFFTKFHNDVIIGIILIYEWIAHVTWTRGCVAASFCMFVVLLRKAAWYLMSHLLYVKCIWCSFFLPPQWILWCECQPTKYCSWIKSFFFSLIFYKAIEILSI